MKKIQAQDLQIGDVINHVSDTVTVLNIRKYGNRTYITIKYGDGVTCTVGKPNRMQVDLFTER